MRIAILALWLTVPAEAVVFDLGGSPPAFTFPGPGTTIATVMRVGGCVAQPQYTKLSIVCDDTRVSGELGPAESPDQGAVGFSADVVLTVQYAGEDYEAECHLAYDGVDVSGSEFDVTVEGA